MADQPIIKSLLDSDMYKFTMGQMIHHTHPNVPVTLTFINRTDSVLLGKVIDVGRLREELEHCMSCSFSLEELYYLSGLRHGGRYDGGLIFKNDYLNFLRGFKLPEFDLSVKKGRLQLSFHGDWQYVTYWETLIMSIVNQLYYQALMKKYSRFDYSWVISGGRCTLDQKVHKLLLNPNANFYEFGTRRRFSRDWQDYVVSVLVRDCPDQFKGTSNLFLAKKYGIIPFGTNAHELYMVYSGIYWDKDEVNPIYSQTKVLTDWENEYGLELSIFLPDTFGSDWFFRKVVDLDRLRNWRGSRQDSGVPIVYAEKRIKEYYNAGIDPKEKHIVFSDGLDVDAIIDISKRLQGRIGHSFGWGTNLTNDMSLPSLSIVAKFTRAAGHNVVKLSDDPGKVTGDSEAVSRMVRITGYKLKA